jgi:mRNA interferase RelE/StbE
LRRLPRDVLERIDAALLALEEDARPRECKRLSGPLGNLYALRVGDWRISYAVHDERLIVLVVEIAPRGAAYRRL